MEAMEECAQGIGAAMAAIALVVGLLVGFLLGARTRQLAAKLKEVGRAMRSLTAVFKIKDAGAMDSAEAMQEGEQEDEEEAKQKDVEEETDPMADFLNLNEEAGLDDHPDIDLNPVMMFQIKKAKEAQKLQKQREELAAEGLTEAEIDERLAEGGHGGGGGDGKPNALAVLIAAGARVTAIRSNNNQEQQKKEELRRQQRNIAVFLKTLDIDTSVKNSADDAVKGGKKSALEVARDTKTKPVGGDLHKRVLAQHSYAKSARDLLREHKKVMDAEKEIKKKS